MSEPPLPIGEPGPPGEQGVPGPSVYDIWLDANPGGTLEDFFASLKGEPGEPGEPGLDSEEPGPQGPPGLSAYEVWLEDNPGGTRAAYYAAIKGAQGEPGPRGRPGGLSTASATVQEASSWGVTTTVVDGNLGLTFHVPPGATPWLRGSLTGSENLDTYRLQSHAGVYRIEAPATADALGLPPNGSGTLEVQWVRGSSSATSVATQVLRTYQNVVWQRRSSSAGWTSWEEVAAGTGGGGSVELEGIGRVDIFLCAGQSNMAGRGGPSSAELDPTHPRVYQFGAKTPTLRLASVPLDMHDDNPSAGLSPANVFARRWAEYAGEATAVLLIPAAHGGTGLVSTSDWNWADTSGQWSLSAAMFSQLSAAITAAESKWPGASINVRAMLWHQGENTAGMNQAQFAAALDNLITRVRTGTGVADLPVILGELSPERSVTLPHSSDLALADTPARTPRTALAHVRAGLTRNTDLTHFSRDGVTLLGENMFRAVPAAIANAAGTMQLPPPSVWAWRDGNTVRVEWDAALCRATSYLVETSGDGGVTWSALGSAGEVQGRRAVITAPGRVSSLTHVRVSTVTPDQTSRPSAAVPVATSGGVGDGGGGGIDTGWVQLPRPAGTSWGSTHDVFMRHRNGETTITYSVQKGDAASGTLLATVPPEYAPSAVVGNFEIPSTSSASGGTPAVCRAAAGTGALTVTFPTAVNNASHFIRGSASWPTD